MVHTFEDILIRTPVKPEETASEGAMPQTAWEPPLRDVVRASATRTPPEPSASGTRLPTPGHGPSAPQRPRQQPTNSTPEREIIKGGPAAGGRGEVQGNRQAPIGTGQQGATQHGGKGTTGGPPTRGNGKTRGHATWGRGRNDRHQEAHQEGGADHTGETGTPPPSPPSPNSATPKGHGHTKASGAPQQRCTPAKTCRRSPDLTPHEPHRVAPTDHQSLHRGRRVHSQRQRGLHLDREPQRRPHKPLPHPNRQATTPATARATTQTQRHGRRRGKGKRQRHQGRGTRRRQSDRSGGDPARPRGPHHLPHRTRHTPKHRDP